VELDQAAHDLSNWRENIGEQLEALEAQQIRDTIDALRAGDQQQQQEGPVALDQKVQPQPDQAQPVAEDPVAKALADPAVLNAVQTEVARHTAAAEQARVNYEAAMAQNAAAAAYSLIASFPELQGVHPNQIGTAIQVVSKQNPQRAEQMVRHIDGVSRLVEQHQKAQAAQVQAYAQEAERQFRSYAENEDAKYYDFEKTRPAAEVKAVRENVLRVLSSIYGYSEAELARAYQTNPAARSAAMQKMAYDVTVAQLAREGVAAKQVREIPTVQRPGSPLERGNERDYQLDRLNARLNSSGSVRDAANLLIERRKGRR
jgi:hypothetical protein